MAPVVGGLDDFLGHDEVVPGIDGGRHVIADEMPAVGAFHLPAVGVGQRDFVLAALF